jgi:hypothetical protein
MTYLEILYIILGVCVVAVSIAIVWLANETVMLVKSLRRSAQDTETVTKEIKEKVLLVSEALDRAGQAAASVIGLIEDSVEAIKEKRDQIVGSIGLITGAGSYIRRRKAASEKKKAPSFATHYAEATRVKKATEGLTASPKKSAKSVEKRPEEEVDEKEEKIAEEKEGEEKLDELAGDHANARESGRESSRK